MARPSVFYFLGVIRDRQDHILQLLDMHCGSDQPRSGGGGGSGGASGNSAGSGGKDDANPGYLVLMKCSRLTQNSSSGSGSGNRGLDDDINWTGDTIYVKPTAETTISLSQIEVSLNRPRVGVLNSSVKSLFMLRPRN